jgi:hypothetical protein
MTQQKIDVLLTYAIRMNKLVRSSSYVTKTLSGYAASHAHQIFVAILMNVFIHPRHANKGIKKKTVSKVYFSEQIGRLIMSA